MIKIPKESQLNELFSRALRKNVELSREFQDLLLVWETEVRPSLLSRSPFPTEIPQHFPIGDEHPSSTQRFELADLKGYLTVGLYPNNVVGRVALEIAKKGSFISGIMDALCNTLSIALQHGIPLSLFTSHYRYTRFEPNGLVANPLPELRGFHTSIMDYIAHYLDIRFPLGQASPESLEIVQPPKFNPALF